MCFFLQSQIWHERTENTVSLLAKASKNAAKLLGESNKLQADMIKKQSQILKNETLLTRALKINIDNIDNFFREFKLNLTKNQKQQPDIICNLITDVTRILLGEFTWIDSLLAY